MDTYAQDKKYVLYTNDGVAHEGTFKRERFNFTDVKTEKETVYDKRDQCCRGMKGDSFVIIIKRNQLKYTNAQDDVPAIIKFYNDRAKISIR